jgi:hypothetical protein
MYRKFRFKKKFECEEGEIHEGSEIVLMDNGIYFDGGLLNPAYYGIMMELINNPKIHKEYLVEMVPNREAYANNF